MRVSFNWLKEFLGVSVSVEEADATLTMLGLEVEGAEQVGDDYALEVNVTPNRPDCLSHMGIARELSASTGGALKAPDCTVEGDRPTSIRVEILDKPLCRRYAARAIRGVKIGESPSWLKARLETCGMRPINNVVDITNYVLLELGHPLHAFDLDTLKGQSIRVGRAGGGRKIKTLDGVERDLPADALLIWDAERPVAVAGVMGGAETEVTGGTKDILLESAHFEPTSVRRTSRALGLKTESSYRFERGTDIVGLEAALDRATRLVLEVAGGLAEEKVDAYPAPFKPAPVEAAYEKVNRVLGTGLSKGEMVGLLRKLGLEVREGEDAFTVVPPSFRHDLAVDADLIEEVARLYGYQRIATRVPVAGIAPGEASPRRRQVSTVREAMRAGGFSEAISYSFMNPADLDTLRIPADDIRRRCVAVMNPLRREDSLLRTTLAPSLLAVLSYNFFRGAKDIRLFEIANVFERTEGALPREALRLGGVYSVDRAHTLWKEAAGAFYVVKGVVESLLDGLRIEGRTFQPSSEPFLHPGKSAELLVGGEKAGYLGVVSPDIIEKLDIKSRLDAVIFEIDLEALASKAHELLVAYSAVPRHPQVERDLSVLVGRGVTAAEALAALRSHPSEYVEEVAVFDSYEGKGVPEGKKSLAFSVRYRAKDRTLTDAEVDLAHARLSEHLKRATGAEVRG